jgi:uncharacterized membrane protein YhaH (DUF805 family)
MSKFLTRAVCVVLAIVIVANFWQDVLAILITVVFVVVAILISTKTGSSGYGGSDSEVPNHEH